MKHPRKVFPETSASRSHKKAELGKAIRRREAEEWLERNWEALEAYNEHVDKHGVFSEGTRSF